MYKKTYRSVYRVYYGDALISNAKVMVSKLSFQPRHFPWVPCGLWYYMNFVGARESGIRRGGSTAVTFHSIITRWLCVTHTHTHHNSNSNKYNSWRISYYHRVYRCRVRVFIQWTVERSPLPRCKQGEYFTDILHYIILINIYICVCVHNRIHTHGWKPQTKCRR